MFRYSVRSMSSEQSESEPSEKVPLVAVKFDSLAKLLFHRSLTFENGSGGGGGGGGSAPSSATTAAAGLGGSRDSDLSSPSSR